jgi:hypothetical protein
VVGFNSPGSLAAIETETAEYADEIASCWSAGTGTATRPDNRIYTDFMEHAVQYEHMITPAAPGARINNAWPVTRMLAASRACG